MSDLHARRRERAGGIRNIGFCKLKLKRFGGLTYPRGNSMRCVRTAWSRVLGDGLGIELGCWMESCVARTTIRNAGEFNGFLEGEGSAVHEPLQFTAGELILPAGFWPMIDRDVLAAHETIRERFTSATVLPTGN